MDKHNSIYLKREAYLHLSMYCSLFCKVLIVTDNGVPNTYVTEIKKQCKMVTTYVIPQGEKQKNLEHVHQICEQLASRNFQKEDLMIALGGGVVCDVAGYAASIYQYGMHLVYLPTTTMAQIDSCIGGRCSIHLADKEDILAISYEPQVIIIDPVLLATLPRRIYYSGLVEGLKVALLCDEALFSMYENYPANFYGQAPPYDIEEILHRSIIDKENIVSQDSCIPGYRDILQFGHLDEDLIQERSLYHGEKVGIGLLVMVCDITIRNRLRAILQKMDMPIIDEDTRNKIYELWQKRHVHDVQIHLHKIGEAYLKQEMEDITEGGVS